MANGGLRAGGQPSLRLERLAVELLGVLAPRGRVRVGQGYGSTGGQHSSESQILLHSRMRAGFIAETLVQNDTGGTNLTS